MLTLQGLIFTPATLRHVSIIEATVEGARFGGAEIYGISAWDLTGIPENETELMIRASYDEPQLIVDSLDLAQLVFLLYRSGNLRRILNLVTATSVLLLGRFTGDGAETLALLRTAVRRADLIPIVHCPRSALDSFDMAVLLPLNRRWRQPRIRS